MPPWKAVAARRAQVQGRPVALRAGDRHARRLGRGRRPGGRPGRPAAAARSSPTTGSSARPTSSSTSARDFAVPASGRGHLPLLRRSRPTWTRTSTSRRSSTGRATAGSSTTSWPTSTPRARPGSATQADPGPGYHVLRAARASRSTATSAAGRPATSRASLPEGIGRSLPEGADVIVQVHYHPSGKPETDRTRIGLYFARKPVKQTLHWSAAANPETGAPARRVERRGQGRLGGPGRRRRPRRHAAHAPARPRHADVGHVPRRPRRRT